MIPVVNHDYRYIMMYSAKVGCTALRELYLHLHKSQMSASKQAQLSDYHNLNHVCPYDESIDYSDYQRFLVTRNPYGRIVSSFLDKYVYGLGREMEAMFERWPCSLGRRPDNFIEFLQYLATVEDADRDAHFQTQSYLLVNPVIITPNNTRFRWTGYSKPTEFPIHFQTDISNMNPFLKKVYKKIFKRDKALYQRACAYIDNQRRRNSIFYAEAEFPEAATMPIAALNELVWAPKPQDFLHSNEVRELIHKIYFCDFFHFGYDRDDVPHKTVKPEAGRLPDDFNWRDYIDLSLDLRTSDEVYSERTAVRHFLEFGGYEQPPRPYSRIPPTDFDWRTYLDLNPDLGEAGISSEYAAVEHYLIFGRSESRPYLKSGQ